MENTGDRSLSRATVLGAVIGGVCVIIAALISVVAVNRSADKRVEALQEKVQNRDQLPVP